MGIIHVLRSSKDLFSYKSSSARQWYPGHIARAERLLKQQLKLVDMVVELPTWIGKRKHLLILNRDDMISTEDREQWSAYFQSQKQYCIFTNAQMGQGVNKVHKAASIIGESINEKRAKRGEGGEDLRWNLEKRYGKAIEDTTPEEYVEWLAIERFKGDPEQAGLRLLGDYRKGYLGNAALELPVEF
eukprot:gene9753-11557_t